MLRRPIDPAQYLAIRYTERLAEAGIEPSVGTVGDSFDNALAETVIGLFRTEVIKRLGPWRNADAVEYAVLEWVDWFDHRRLLGPLGYIPRPKPKPTTTVPTTPQQHPQDSHPKPSHEATAVHTDTWGSKYPAIIRLWENAWTEFAPFLA